MDKEQFIERLKAEFPRLMREDPAFYYQVVGLLTHALSSREETNRLFEEIRALREQNLRQFEAMQQRFDELLGSQARLEGRQARLEERQASLEEGQARLEERQARLEEGQARLEERQAAMERRQASLEEGHAALRERVEALEAGIAELRVGMSSLGVRGGKGLEHAVRRVIERFSGLGPLKAQRLVVQDPHGEVLGLAGEIEIDAYVHDGHRFLVEIKSHPKTIDVLLFARKAGFVERHLGVTAQRVLIALQAERKALRKADELGIQVISLGSRKVG